MNLLNSLKKISPFNKSQFCICQSVRHRTGTDPGTLFNRLFRAVTQPILPFELDKLDIAVSSETKKTNEMQLYNYGQFLIRKCKEEVIDASKGRMLLILQLNHHKKYHLFKIQSDLFDHGMSFSYYPSEIVREAAKGTNISSVIDLLYLDCVLNMSIVGDCSPAAIRVVMDNVKKMRNIMMIGGIVDYRIMNVDQITAYMNLESIENTYESLAHTLSTCQNEIASNINYHQNNLVANLSELSNRNK